MKKIAFLYTITLGVLWETAYAFVIIGAGVLMAFLLSR